MKLKVGDIFTIPISDSKTGFGQIINIPNKNNFIIVVFEGIHETDWLNLDEIVNDRILFLGYTMDAKLYHKNWKIIGNQVVNLTKIKLPYFKLGTPPDCRLVDYKGDLIKSISRDVFELIEYQEIVAPIRYENALKAYHKLVEWREDYDRLLYGRTLESIKVVEKQ